MIVITFNKTKPIILASSSPRRKELLRGLQLDFIAHPSDVDENVTDGLTPQEIVQQLSLRKAESLASCYEDGLVIGSDTIVVSDNEILGKPLNAEDSFRMLSLLQGRSHYVYSGIAMVDIRSGRTAVSHSKTEVFIKQMDQEKILRYIATGEPNDKAGSYAIQGFGAAFVERIEGDYFTVVGLPVSLLSEMLLAFDVHIF